MARGVVIDLDDASGINYRVVAESGSIKEMKNGSSIFGRKSSGAVVHHHFLRWVHSEFAAYVSLLAFTAPALSAFSVENGDHMVSFFHVPHTFADAFNDSAHLHM